jgi:IPT/TIG domain
VSSSQVNATAPAQPAGTVNVTLTTPAGTSAVTGGDEYTYSDLPLVQGLSVNHGPVAGGTHVTIDGTNFSGATAVNFGTTAATSFTVTSSIEVKAVSPAHTAGAVHITVTTPAGTSIINGNDIFSFGATGGVIDASAAGGTMHGGTLLRIYGSQLGGARKVFFGHTAAARLIHVSGHEIDVISPPHLPGTVNLHAYTAAGAAIPGTARYTFRKR